MTRRKLYRRTQQKSKFHEIQELFQENVYSIQTKSENENSDRASTSNLQQRSPESVLFEPKHVDLCCNELSPDIIDKFSRIKLENSIEVANEVTTEETAQLNLSTPKRNIRLDRSLKYSEFRYPNNYSKDNIKSIFNELSNSAENFSSKEKILLSTNNELNCDQITSVMYNKPFTRQDSPNPKLVLSSSEYELSYGNTSPFQATVSHSCLKSPNNISIFTVPNVSKNESVSIKNTVITGKSLEKVPVLQKDHDIDKTMNDCYLLNQTLSINDDLINEMNIYLDKQSLVDAGNHINKVTSSITNCKLQNKYITESGNFANSMDKTDTQSTFVNEIQSSVDEYETIELIDKDDRSQNNSSKKGELNDNKNLAAVEKITEQLVANWNEFRKIFAYLLQINKKLCKTNISNNVPVLAKYNKLIEDHTSFSEFSSSTICTPHYLPLKNSKNSGDHSVIRSSLMNEDRNSEQSRRREKIRCSSREHPTTPCRGSLSSAKRCRVILQFGKNEEVKNQQQLERHQKITDPLGIEKKSQNDSFSLNLRPHNKIYWNNCTSELTPLSVTDLLAMSDYDRSNVNLQEVNVQDETSKRYTKYNTATLETSLDDLSQQGNTSYIIKKIIDFCIWLMKKLLHLLNNSCKNLRQIIIPTSSTKLKKTLQMEEFKHLIAKLRTENDRMICILSEKMTNFSTNLIQIQTNTEVTLNALKTEMNIMRKANEEITEDNKIIIEEMKQQYKTLQDIRLKSVESILLPSSSIDLLPPPPPPPPPPAPPLPSLSFLPQPLLSSMKSHSLVSISSVPSSPSSLPPLHPPPPPPPPPSSLFVAVSQSPILSTSTLNNDKRNKISVTKCSTPLLKRPSITVEDLLKVTLKKAPQNIRDNRRKTVPGPTGPVISLDMLRNVKLKSARRRTNDHNVRSPRSGRIMKNRIASTLSLSPIATGSEGNLERILRQVDFNKRGPRRFLSTSTNFRVHDSPRNAQPQLLETLKHSQSQSVIE